VVALGAATFPLRRLRPQGLKMYTVITHQSEGGSLFHLRQVQSGHPQITTFSLSPSVNDACLVFACLHASFSCLQSSTPSSFWSELGCDHDAETRIHECFQFQRTACCVRPSSPWAGVGEVVSRIWTGSSWPGAPSFHGEQETLAGRPFTALFIFGVDYMSTIMEYNSRLHIR
jgi:hypothetical protein